MAAIIRWHCSMLGQWGRVMGALERKREWVGVQTFWSRLKAAPTKALDNWRGL
jgi:hypothetical protein